LNLLCCALNGTFFCLQPLDLVAGLNFDDLNITSQEDEILNEDEALEGTTHVFEVLSG
jgi:hypothetical protein